MGKVKIDDEIKRIRKEFIPSQRIQERIKFEKLARDYLSEKSLNSFKKIEDFILAIDSDYWEDEHVLW